MVIISIYLQNDFYDDRWEAKLSVAMETHFGTKLMVWELFTLFSIEWLYRKTCFPPVANVHFQGSIRHIYNNILCRQYTIKPYTMNHIYIYIYIYIGEWGSENLSQTRTHFFQLWAQEKVWLILHKLSLR